MADENTLQPPAGFIKEGQTSSTTYEKPPEEERGEGWVYETRPKERNPSADALTGAAVGVASKVVNPLTTRAINKVADIVAGPVAEGAKASIYRSAPSNAVINWTKAMHITPDISAAYGAQEYGEAHRRMMAAKEAREKAEKLQKLENLFKTEEEIRKAATPVADVVRTASNVMTPTGESMLGKAASLGAHTLGRALAGGSAAYQGVDAWNRLKRGDYAGATIGGIGALGSAAALIPTPATRVIGSLVGAGTELGNVALDKYKESQQHGMASGGQVYQRYPHADEVIPQGLVKPRLAEGGDVKKSEANEGAAFIGYPQINKNRKIGSGTGFLDALVGAPASRTNVLNPSDYSYMEGYEKGEPYGIAAMALPFAGAAAKPLAKEIGTRAFMGETLTPKMMRNLMVEAPALSAVKGPGGNWADNRLDATLNQVKSSVPTINTSKNITQDAGNFIRYNYPEVDEGYNQYFKNTGKHSMEYGKDYWSWMQENHPQQFAALSENKTPSHAMNSWVDSKLKKYIKNDLATPNDPVRELADKGISHLSNLEDRYSGLGDRMKNFRASQGFEPLGYSKSNMGHVWENLADYNVYPTNIKTYAEENPATAKLNSWIGDLAAKDPKATINDLDRSGTTNLGFDHLMDELRNSITPNSGLPQHLQLKPGALDRVTVPQAVQHVAKINEWRAQQMAQQQLKVQEGLPVHKQYDTGYKWLELKHPENDEFTEKALKYEGDTMGHCVGGYCPDVLSGKTKIYSLRDAKGEPHVTVEVGPNDHLDFNTWLEKQPKALHQDLNSRVKRGEIPSVYDAPEYLTARAAVPPRILQIKGKQNSAPKAEYQPFVQDFVRSGNWSEVRDLKNAGLLDTKNLKGSNYFNPAQVVDESGNAQRYVTQQELNSFNQ